MSTLFIADLHLDEQRPEITRALLHFLETHARSAEALYILGDFFEVWVGDDDQTPMIESVRQGLRTLADHGTAIYLQHGNRDFLIGQCFAQSCGAQLIPEHQVISPYGQPLLLLHGDQLCLEDTDYLAFRQQVRAASWQRDFLSQSLEQRKAIARHIRETSRDLSRQKPQTLMDVTPAEVTRVMNQAGVDTLIHGHTHRPAVHTLADRHQRIVLGDWDSNGWYLQWHADNRFELIDFPINRSDA